MAKSKLKAALDAHKGRDFKLEKQRKLEKEARKRKQAKGGEEAEVEDKDEEAGGVELEEVEIVNGKIVVDKKEKKGKKGKKEKKEKKTNGAAKEPEEAAWETEESEDEDEDEDEQPVVCSL